MEGCISAIAKQVREHGSAAAVELEGHSFSYADVEGSSAGLASALRELKVGTNRVLVFSQRPETFVVALLGILRAECTFVPVLSELPLTRLRYIADKVAPIAVVHDKASREAAERVFPELPRLSLFELRGDAAWPDLPADHPAYIYFTSGSTGQPKGIVGRYESLSQYIHWEAELLGGTAGMQVSQLISPMFDAFLRDSLLPLTVGGSCRVPGETTRQDAGRLARWISESGVQVVHTVPSVFRNVLAAGPDLRFPTLRHVLLSGESLLASDVRLWQERLGSGVGLYNLYGATETTMTKFVRRVSSEDALATAVPIGRPMTGATAWIAGEDLKPVPNGEVGEIVVETKFGTLGYLDAPEATAQVFVPLAEDPSRIVYKTGDLGRMRYDGAFECLGRRDRQLKVRGVRIEPIEIEEAARSLAGVLDCVADAETLTDGGVNLVLYVVLAPGVEAGAVRAALQECLPAVYLPSSIRPCRELPRLLSGKVDLSALRGLSRTSRQHRELAQTPTEEFVLQLYCELVQDDMLGVEDGFFDVGGHSLLAIQVVSRIREQRNVEVPLGALFENSTARRLATYIDQVAVPVSARVESAPAPIELEGLSDGDLDRLLADLTQKG